MSQARQVLSLQIPHPMPEDARRADEGLDCGQSGESGQFSHLADVGIRAPLGLSAGMVLNLTEARYDRRRYAMPSNHSETGDPMLISFIVFAAAGAVLGGIAGAIIRALSRNHPTQLDWRKGVTLGAAMGAFAALATGGTAGPYPTPKNITPIAESAFDQEVMQAKQPVVVDFFATWCGPCKLLAPRLDALAGDYAGKIKFVEVNVDKAPKLSAQFNIQGVPTVIFVKDAKVVDRVIGLRSKADLKERLETLLAGEVRR